MNYYNDNDKFCINWLKALIKEKLIPNGDVDERSITDVKASDLKGYTQCHFFAGIGGWSYALQLAGWSSTRPVWTGSCPCQPLSVAGIRRGNEDKRHLWPEFARLICECEPSTVFGEQVASKDGREWFAGVRLDLEEMGYVVGASDLPAAGIGAPQIRQRLWWVADRSSFRCDRLQERKFNREEEKRRLFKLEGNSEMCWLSEEQSDTRTDQGKIGRIMHVDYSKTIWWPCSDGKWRRVAARWVGDTDSKQINTTKPGQQVFGEGLLQSGLGNAESNDKRWNAMSRCNGERQPCGGSGRDIECDAGYDRLEVEPSLFPLAPGIPGSVGLLRGAGNSIHPHVAVEFIKAFMEIKQTTKSKKKIILWLN